MPTVSFPEPEITLSEEAGVRYLHFGSEWVQGAMRVSRPDELVLDYVQQMMGWLLFLDAPPRILQLGLGAGSLTRFCRKRFPQTHITVVDASRRVIEAAHACFALPRDDARLAVVHDDAQVFVSREHQKRAHGVVQADLYDADALGPTIESQAFYSACAEALDEPGIFVVNLFGKHRSWQRNLTRVTQAFDARIVELPPLRAGNRIVLGFKGPRLEVDWALLDSRAARLRREFGLPAHDWVLHLRAQRKGPMFAI